MRSEAVILKSRPTGKPEQSNFSIEEIKVADPSYGQLLIENQVFTVDPYMRGRMVDRESYVPPFQIGQPLDGGTVGRVIKSSSKKFPEGSLVSSETGGWRRHAVVDTAAVRLVDTSVFQPSDYLGAAGMPGLTAYAGLFEIGRPRAGQTVLVSAASGAVGALVCQFARLNGCHVIGSAGSAEKVAWLQKEAKVQAFNYHDTKDLGATFKEMAPNGIDVYWDNVGGEFLEAALGSLNQRGAVVMCGMISSYNDEKPAAGPRNLGLAVGKRLRLEGFIVRDHWNLMDEYLQRLAGWKASGEVTWEETVFEGLEKAPDAFIGLFEGSNLGKTVVSLNEPSRN